MSDETESTPKEEQAGPDDLDAVLDKVIESQPEEESGEEQPEPPNSDEDPPQEPEGQASETDEGKSEEEQAEVLDVPEDFPADRREALAALPAEARKVVLDQYKDFQAGFTKKTQELAEQRRAVEPVTQLLESHKDYFARRGIPEAQRAQAISSLIQAENILSSGTPEQKRSYFHKLARDYGINLASPGSEDTEYEDPQIASHDPRVDQLVQRFQERERREVMERQQELQRDIEAFQAAVDEQGNPKHPHFEQVRGTMSQLLESGVVENLDDAYGRAVRLDDTLFNESLERERQKVAEAEAKKRQEAVEKAKAAAPKKGKSEPGKGGKKAETLDDAVTQAMEAMGT